MKRFLPGFVGGKQYWVSRLDSFKNRPVTELFCGSAVLSANLGSSAVINDSDPMLYKILSRFDEQIVPDVFTREDYFRVRGQEDWWRYAFCLQGMSFSSVFRYSKNGYNVPAKKKEKVELRELYDQALVRWRELRPTVLNLSFDAVSMEHCVGRLVILDPPYEGSKAYYNSTTQLDYPTYWSTVEMLKHYASGILLFDRKGNLDKQSIPTASSRPMRVNGQFAGDVESLAIWDKGTWLTELPGAKVSPEAADKANETLNLPVKG